MIGTNVKHKQFGEGRITEINKNIITIAFAAGEKKFTFPDAFGPFLSTEEPSLNDLVRKLKDEASLKNSRKPMVAIPSRIPTQAPPPKKKSTIERLNIAFKCNFCDGGCSENSVGYKGVCSDKTIIYNIEVAKHVWCSSDALCNKYYNREINREELLAGFSCYESTMLTEWKASAGIVQTGPNKGKPMKLMKVQNNSLAVLTTRTPGSVESERFIFAVFLVDESYEGDGKDEGYVTNNSDWRIELTPEESHKMLFWNYYLNANAPKKIAFGSGLHRYLSDMQAAQILMDIIGVKNDEKEKEFAQKFLDHFCSVVGFNAKDIEQPSGALAKISRTAKTVSNTQNNAVPI